MADENPDHDMPVIDVFTEIMGSAPRETLFGIPIRPLADMPPGVVLVVSFCDPTCTEHTNGIHRSVKAVVSTP